MPRQTDQSEPSSVPPPELNPLLNPLLAKNMGRWAEVYFTSPPERRDEAVQELLHQLRIENATHVEDVEPILKRENYADTDAETKNPIEPAPVPPHIVCMCGHENPLDQRFCGMCGVPLSTQPLSESRSPRDLPVIGNVPVFRQAIPSRGDEFTSEAAGEKYRDQREREIQQREADEREAQEREAQHQDYLRHEQQSRANEEVHAHEEEQAYAQHEAESSEASSPDLVPIETVRGIFNRGAETENYHLFESDEPSSFAYSYRVAIGLVLAILIGGLAYMAWKGGQTSSQLAPQNPPAASDQSAAPPAGTDSSSSDSNGSERSKQDESATPAPKQNTASTRKAAAPEQPAESSRRTEAGSAPKSTKPAPTPTGPTKAAPAPSASGGAEELATAKHFLNGSAGSRNTAEAADWLWKSVAKQNSEATVLLADLYLKGDGVSKNCDQARILLDAAARKGRADAGERLRHMQAFGCR